MKITLPTDGAIRPRTRAARSLIGLVLLLIATTGCSTKIPGISAIAPTANPSEEIESLASEVETARGEALDVLSPTWFARAESRAKNAKSQLTDGESVRVILQNVAEGRAALAQARTFGEVSRQTLPSVIKARTDAIAAGAPQLGNRYDDVEERFLELTAAVESDSMNWARRTAPEVEKSFREIELASIKKNTVYRIVDLIEKAKEADADRFAPKLLKDVEARYAELDQFISQNRYSSEAMGEKADEVLFYANRLVHVTEEARRVERLNPTEIALQNEANLLALSQKLELPDLRNQSQASQRRQIENAIDEVLRTRHDLRRKVDSQRAQIDALQDTAAVEGEQLAVLEHERRINQLFLKVSAMFSPGEAEVYRKENQIVIRVRSLKFPVGTAIVQPESYPVLAKVQKSITSFDHPRVIVEGHTDSTGSAEVNDRISQERADAVLAYLVNNRTVDASRIQAVGKGFSEPLASDRTAEGRAANRRIDVVIDPGQPEEFVSN